MTDDARANRKALPTFAGRFELQDEVSLMQALWDANPCSVGQTAVATIGDLVGRSFDMGGADATSYRLEASADDALAARVIAGWAAAGWPKRVVRALSATTPFQGQGDLKETLERLLSDESDVKLLVGETQQPNYAEKVAFFEDPSMPYDGSDDEDDDDDDDDEDNGPPGIVVCSKSCGENDDDVFESELLLASGHKDQTRLVVLQRGNCASYSGKCEGHSCRRASRALINFAATYSDWCANDSLASDQDIDEMCDDGEWTEACSSLFETRPDLLPCRNRVAVRADTTFYASGDHSGVYLSLPLTEAIESGDYTIGVIAISVTTD